MNYWKRDWAFFLLEKISISIPILVSWLSCFKVIGNTESRIFRNGSTTEVPLVHPRRNTKIIQIHVHGYNCGATGRQSHHNCIFCKHSMRWPLHNIYLQWSNCICVLNDICYNVSGRSILSSFAWKYAIGVYLLYSIKGLNISSFSLFFNIILFAGSFQIYVCGWHQVAAGSCWFHWRHL